MTTEAIESGHVASILEILAGLPSDMLLSDGGTDWSVECLVDAIRDAEEADAREYTLGYTSDGRVTISEYTDAGLVNPPAYVQVVPD